MKKRLPYSKKVLYMSLGLLLALVAGYQLALSRTLELYRENQRLIGLNSKDQSEFMREIAQGTMKKKHLDSLLSQVNMNASRSEMINELFRTAERNNLMVAGAYENLKQETGEYYHFKFSGPYISMVRFIRSVENTLSSGKIESVTIYKETDRRTKQEHLLLELIIRRLEYGS